MSHTSRAMAAESRDAATPCSRYDDYEPDPVYFSCECGWNGEYPDLDETPSGQSVPVCPVCGAEVEQE